MYVIYSLLTVAGMLLASPYFLIRGLIRGKNLTNIPERLGWRFPAELTQDANRASENAIWIHAVSVGEVLAVLPLAKKLRERHPERRLLISTTTYTGQQLARERMPFANAVFYFPLDWARPVRRVLKAVRPSIVIVVETEIWPNFLRECRRANIPVIFVNGRLSERSFRGFLRALTYSGGMLRGFLTRILNDATLFLMQGKGDADRLLALGAPDRRVMVTGNLKYDFADPSGSVLSQWLESVLADGVRGPVMIAGSVMANEEPAILRAVTEVEREFPKALLILAPRRPEQFDNAAKSIAQAGRPIVRRSELSMNGNGHGQFDGAGSVLLLDSLGELADLYRLGDVVFVGGSLTSNGGHNILEPAAFGKVPVHGPSMENFREMSARFSEEGASICVNDGQELGTAWRDLLRDSERAARMGRAARDLAGRGRGATTRVLMHIEEIIGPATERDRAEPKIDESGEGK